jgi:predicted ATPase
MAEFVGRAEPLARLAAAYRAGTGAGAGAGPGGRGAGLALVTGEAGIGKTALLSRFAADAADAGAVVVWGTCWDGDQAPAWWPWTQALRVLLDRRGVLRAHAGPRLAAVVPELGAGAGGTDRLPVFDAVARLLIRATFDGPVVVILDDLQWADRSTVDLMRYLVHRVEAGGVLLVGAYRPAEVGGGAADTLADLAAAAELVTLRGLPPGDVDDMVRTVAGDAAAERWAASVYERSGGHPFFARELCHLIMAGGPPAMCPPPSVWPSPAGWPGCRPAAPRCSTWPRSPVRRCSPTCSPTPAVSR